MTKLNATFFALQRRDRAVLLPVTIVLVVVLAVILGAFAALNWRAITSLYELFRSFPADPKTAPGPEMIGPMFGLFGSIFLFMFPFYMAVAAYEAACLRWLIRGEAPGLFGYTFGPDMWRVYGVYWCWLIVQMVVGMVVSIATMPLLFGTMGEVMRNPTDMQVMWHWQLTVQLPLTFLQYIPLIFLGVRFGPAAATSIGRRRFSFLEAWTVTRGRFWALLGSFALVWGIWIAVAAAAAAPLTIRMWPHFTAMYPAPTDAGMAAYFAAYTEPTTLALVALSYGVMLIGSVWVALMSFGINARAVLVALEEEKISAEPA